MITHEYKVLIVDDDKLLTKLLTKAFIDNNIELFSAGTIAGAVSFINDNRESIDLLVLDMNLPDGFGIDLLKNFREDNLKVPVIMLSSNTTEMAKVMSLEIGADDYICKPFSLPELISRVKAVLRRSGRKIDAGDILSARDFPASAEKIYNYKSLSIDFINRQVTIEGSAVKLNYKEFEIIKLLVIYKNNIVTSEQIINEVWKDSLVDKKTIEPHISRIRKKIGIYSRMIETVMNLGYRFNE